jgi:hypothetical protein
VRFHDRRLQFQGRKAERERRSGRRRQASPSYHSETAVVQIHAKTAGYRRGAPLDLTGSKASSARAKHGYTRGGPRTRAYKAWSAMTRPRARAAPPQQSGRRNLAPSPDLTFRIPLTGITQTSPEAQPGRRALCPSRAALVNPEKAAPMNRNRHARRAAEARKRASRAVAYQLSFVTGLDLFGGETDGVGDAAEAIASVLSRLASGPPPLCVTCDHEFQRGGDLPALVMIAKPWASAGPLLTGGICSTCARQGHVALVAACLAAFRASGMPDARMTQAGAA